MQTLLFKSKVIAEFLLEFILEGHAAAILPKTMEVSTLRRVKIDFISKMKKIRLTGLCLMDKNFDLQR